METAKAKAVEVSNALGIGLPPIMNQHCPECNTFHMIDLSDVCDQRFGRAPVDVPKSEKPSTWYERKYCEVCSAYHNKDGYCPGPRENIDWSNKVMR